MNETRVVGKNVLESLTVGMYKDSFTIYREYIQNCSDAIDEAIAKGYLKAENAEIRIRVSDEKRRISIRDNGIGVSKDKAFKTLGDIGNSQKKHDENRGFRGIGRLAGLTYAQKVQFITSFPGEPYKTTISIDCSKMRLLLRDGNHIATAIEVVNDITAQTIDHEKEELHYFEVILDGILDDASSLLDVDRVKEYLKEVAPIPFDDIKFVYAKFVKERIKAFYKQLEEYKIYVNDGSQPLRKPYKTVFKTGHRESARKHDQMTGIEHFEQYDSEGNLLYYGWYGKSSLNGTVKDKEISGLRIRKGNILIGDGYTCGQFFPDPRLNGWLIGEVYIYGKNIIPNSQRDDFEENEAFFELREFFSLQAKKLHSLIRNTSDLNSRLNTIQEGETELEEIKHAITSGGITSESQRETLLKQQKDIEAKVEKAEKELKKITEKIDDDRARQKAEETLGRCGDIKKKIVATENDIINAGYGTKGDLPTSYSRDEQKVYQRIIKVLYDNLNAEQAAELRKKIIAELSAGNGKGSRKK